MLFVDIVGFTRLSETMAPADAMALLRGFHTRVERAVFAHGGMVDKFMGDGAMACFGVPERRRPPRPTRSAPAFALLTALEPPADGARAAQGRHRHPSPARC